jgi:hypothetical protein
LCSFCRTTWAGEISVHTAEQNLCKDAKRVSNGPCAVLLSIERTVSETFLGINGVPLR